MTADAFAHLALSLRRQLVLRATRTTRDVDEASDMVDGVIARALPYHENISAEAAEPYLRRALTNAIRDRYKNVGRRCTVRLDDARSSGWEPVAPDGGAAETAPEVARAIAALPPIYRDAIIRAYWRDEPPGAARIRVHRARRMLARNPELQRYAGWAA